MSKTVCFQIQKARSRWHDKRDLETIQSFNTKAEAEALYAYIGEAVSTIDLHTTLLADQPHPKLPDSNLTARNYAVWLLMNAKLPGICKAIELVQEAVEQRPHYTDNIIPFPLHRRGSQESALTRQRNGPFYA